MSHVPLFVYPLCSLCLPTYSALLLAMVFIEPLAYENATMLLIQKEARCDVINYIIAYFEFQVLVFQNLFIFAALCLNIAELILKLFEDSQTEVSMCILFWLHYDD